MALIPRKAAAAFRFGWMPFRVYAVEEAKAAAVFGLTLLTLGISTPVAAVRTFPVEPIATYYAAGNHMQCYGFAPPYICAQWNPAHRYPSPEASCNNTIYNELRTYGGLPLYGAHVQGPYPLPSGHLYLAGQPGFECFAYYDIPPSPGVPPKPPQKVHGGLILRDGVCPVGATGYRVSAYEFVCRATCQDDQKWVTSEGRCFPYRDRTQDEPKLCPASGNPIYPLTGAKRQTQALDASIGAQAIALAYDTREKLPQSPPGSDGWLEQAPQSFGRLWQSSVHRRLVPQIGVHTGGTSIGSLNSTVAAHRGEGIWQTFALQSGTRYISTLNPSDQLEYANLSWLLRDTKAQNLERYNQSGVLLQSSTARGTSLSFAYSDSSTPASIAPKAGLLISVADAFGRSTQFAYENAPDSQVRIHRMTRHDGIKLNFGYDAAGNLQTIRWGDSTLRTFMYERSDLPWALTGITDELNRRHSTYGYDTSGRATSTEAAGGSNRHTVAYTQAPIRSVSEVFDPVAKVIWRDHRWQLPQDVVLTEPLGNAVSIGAVDSRGMPRQSSRSQPAGSGCDASTSAQAYDANGNIASSDDFNGHRVCYSYDLSRNLELVRVEGLAGGTACTSTAAGAALPAGARKVSTQWHPQWRLQTKLAEPGRITTSVYNGQPDPFNGNALASCAPASAKLPDNTPIAVLCRQVKQASTDADGALGLAAALQTGVAAREQRWTYNEFGQVLTHKGPRTDVADTTVYEYHAATSFTGVDPHAVGVTRGDLRKVTLPAGGFTLYKLYNKLGQVLETEDANGVITTYTYDLRQRLTSMTVAGQTTLYDYWPTGLIKKITQPDLSWVSYEHDDAHRLVKVSDNLDNSITYTLDNLGNRVDEQVKDPSGALRRNLGRGIDALGRVQQVTGRE